MIDQTHDPELRSWVESANNPATDFPIQNLPFATFRKNGDHHWTPGVAIGDQLLDLASSFQIASVRDVMAMPCAARVELRRNISAFLSKHTPRAEAFLTPMADAQLGLPCAIGDYTDFYASIYHARNVGRLFRPDNPLLPNYKWVPVGYHGRASSVVVSGTPVRRPRGQIAEKAGAPPVYAPSRRLDYELELGAFVGPGNPLGDPIPVRSAGDHIAGVCLLNDWSARDIQAWEYQPLGPFLAKNFATSISPFIVTAEALEPFRAPFVRPAGDPQPLPYLDNPANREQGAFDIALEVWLQTAAMRDQGAAAVRLMQSNFRDAYWTLAQLVAHHSSNGCNLQSGDLLGTGTQSGPDAAQGGSLLELSRGGREPLKLPNGETRTFLQDGDTVILRAGCERAGRVRIGFGDCAGTVLPAAGKAM